MNKSCKCMDNIGWGLADGWIDWLTVWQAKGQTEQCSNKQEAHGSHRLHEKPVTQ